MQHYTTIEESKKLVELGLNPDTADMQWFLEDDYGIVQIKDDLSDWGGDCVIPCWSLGALLEVMPLISTNKGDARPFIAKTEFGYYVVYATENMEWNCTPIFDSSLEAIYDMIVHLLENGYIQKGE